jgi:hypothetical protein
MTRIWLSLLIVLSICACRDRSCIIIDHAEAKLEMPRRAESLRTYDRYYVILGRIAKGIFIRSETGDGHIKIVSLEKDLPFVADGGCGVIDVSLNLDTEAWSKPLCHGM